MSSKKPRMSLPIRKTVKIWAVIKTVQANSAREALKNEEKGLIREVRQISRSDQVLSSLVAIDGVVMDED